MSFSYQHLAEISAREIGAKGRDITLRRRSRIFDPANGLVSETVSDQAARGLFTLYEAGQRDGSTIQQGDQGLLLAASGLATPPSDEDEVLDGGLTWQVMRVERLQPGETALLYRLQLRR
jgi:hypothetical protein